MLIINPYHERELFKPKLDGTLRSIRGNKFRTMQPGRCPDFDGLDDYIVVPAASATNWNFGTGSWTVTGWFYTAIGAAYDVLVGKCKITTGDHFRIFKDIANKLVIFNGPDSGGAWLTSINSFTLSAWNFFACGYDAVSGDAFIWLNDTLTESAKTPFDFSNSEDLHIGSDTTPNYHWPGKLYDIRAYNFALSEDGQRSLWSNGRLGTAPTTLPVAHYPLEDTHPTLAFDVSGNANHGTKTNITTSTFHYSGSDVPASSLNDVGYSRGRNMLRWSNSIGNNTGGSAWNRPYLNPTLTLNAGTDPWGNSEASLITHTDPGGDANGGISQDNVPLLASTTYTASVYSKNFDETATNTRTINIGSGANSVTLYYNPVTMTYHSVGDNGTCKAVAGSIEPATNGWYRLVVTFRTTSGWTGGANFFIQNPFTAGRSFLVAGAQLELGGVATEFQKTTTPISFRNAPQNSPIPRDESDKTKDILGNTLEYTGKNPGYAQAEQSNCGTFDGVDDYITIPDDPTLQCTTETLRIAFKVRPINASDWERLVDNQNGAATAGYMVAFVSTDRIRFRLNGSLIDSVQTIPTSEWSDVECVWEDGEMSIWINGVKDPNTLAFAGPIGASATNLSFCTRAGAPGNDIPECNLADVTVSIGGEVRGHWPFSEGAGTTIYDVSGNGNHGTATNITEATFWGTKQDVFHWNLAKGFDGCYELLKASNQFSAYEDATDTDIVGIGTRNYSIKARVQFNSVNDNDVIGSGNTNPGDILLMVFTGKVRGHIWTTGGDGVATGVTPIAIGEWVEIEQRVTSDNKIRVYLNGELEAEADITGIRIGNTDGKFIIGGRNGADHEGRVCDVVITDLDTGEVIANYPLKNANDFHDYSGNNRHLTAYNSPKFIRCPCATNGSSLVGRVTPSNPATAGHNLAESRLDFWPVDAPLLLPSAVGNELSSDDLSNWTFQFATAVPAINVESPLGRQGVFLVQNDGTNAYGNVRIGSPFGSGDYFFSCFFKQGTQDGGIGIRINGVNVGGIGESALQINYNWSTGVVSNPSGNADYIAGVVHYPNGWIRLWMAFPASGVLTAAVYPVWNEATIENVYAFGPQLVKIPDWNAVTEPLEYVPVGFDPTPPKEWVPPVNALVNSRNLASSSWTKTQTSVVDSALTINGYSFSSITEDVTNGLHLASQNPAVPAGRYKGTVLVSDASSRRYLALRIINDSFGSDRFAVVVDTTTGEITDSNIVGSPTGNYAWTRDLGGGITEVNITIDHASGNVNFALCLSDSATPTWSANAPTYAGDGASIGYFASPKLVRLTPPDKLNPWYEREHRSNDVLTKVDRFVQYNRPLIGIEDITTRINS